MESRTARRRSIKPDHVGTKGWARRLTGPAVWLPQAGILLLKQSSCNERELSYILALVRKSRPPDGMWRGRL